MSEPFIVDVGGEGRHPTAWNLNPSRLRTFGPARGTPIPRLIRARSEAMPLANNSVGLLILERTPLRAATIRELFRVIAPVGTIVLRHVVGPSGDPHRRLLEQLAGVGPASSQIERGWSHLGSHRVRETTIRLGASA